MALSPDVDLPVTEEKVSFQRNIETAKAAPVTKEPVMSPTKKVKFDDNVEMPSAIHRKKPDPETESFSPGSKRVAEILRRLEGEITQYYNMGDAKKRNKALFDYCRIANEATQGLNMQNKDEQRAAV
jgi:hypothetical protein